jgi:PAS domain S-box-containing protein
LIADPEPFRARVRQLQVNPHESSEEDLRLADGRVFAHHSAPVVAHTGVPHGRVWFFRDVTAHAEDERRIRDMNAFLDSVVENIPNTVFVKDALTLRYVRFNRAGEELVGFGRDELIGRSDQDLFPPAQAESFVRKDREVLAQRGIVVIEDEQIQTRHRGVRHLITKKIPIVDQDGEPRYLLGISEDITESLRRQQELRSAKEAAEKASRAKSDFLANMSHELRTPLNSILGFARVLDRTSRESLDPKHREYFRYMTQGAQHMLRLVNDLLDLRTLEQDELAVGRVELAPVVHEAAALLQPLIEEKRIRFSLDLPADLAPAVAERRALIQVLINLLSNAVKFTPVEGAIAISVEVDGARVSIRVSDTGIGITATDQARLFTYFEQLGAKHAHNMKGSGIGLALTKMLVVKQGGSIHVDSSPGAGSTFTVALPVCA